MERTFGVRGKCCNRSGTPTGIADQAINRYVLDEHGSDEIYEVTLLDKKEDTDGNIKYTLSVSDESGKEVLQIEYEDDSWWVTVTIND